MSYMIRNCTKLTSLDLSNFSTANVTTMYRAFKENTSLKTINLTGWSVAKDPNVGEMFYGCSALQTIYTSADANWTGNTSDNSNMFYGCTSLRGGQGYYNSSSDMTNSSSSYANYYNKTYARVDGLVTGGSTRNNGYFTANTTGKYAVLYVTGGTYASPHIILP